MKYILLAVAVLVLAAGGFFFWSTQNNEKALPIATNNYSDYEYKNDFASFYQIALRAGDTYTNENEGFSVRFDSFEDPSVKMIGHTTIFTHKQTFTFDFYPDRASGKDSFTFDTDKGKVNLLICGIGESVT